eukprot:7320473-Prymnesium_polylepis.2
MDCICGRICCIFRPIDRWLHPRCGQGAVAGKALAEHPGIAKLDMTGGTETGALAAASASRNLAYVTTVRCPGIELHDRTVTFGAARPRLAGARRQRAGDRIRRRPFGAVCQWRRVRCVRRVGPDMYLCQARARPRGHLRHVPRQGAPPP